MDKELNGTASFMPQNDQLDSEWDEAKLAQLIGFDDFNGNETTGELISEGIDGQEYVLPAGAISIRGTEGQPLIASKWGNKGSANASHDATAFLFGSLAKVGEVMNRPDFESSASTSGSSFSTSTTTRSSSPNLLGAVLEGGFAPLTKQILQRNQRDLQQMLQRQDVWYVRAGTNVQVFINQSFEF